MKEREYLISKIDEILKGCSADMLTAIYRAVRNITHYERSNYNGEEN